MSAQRFSNRREDKRPLQNKAVTVKNQADY